MQSDTRTMIELQRRWDIVIHGRSEIKTAKSVIFTEEKAAASAHAAHSTLKKELLAAKSTQKQKEIDLLDRETLLAKLDEKRFTVQNKREEKAVQTEIERAAAEKGLLEDELLRLMDEIAEREVSFAASEQALAIRENSAAEKIAVMKERVSRFEGIIAENEAAFNAGLSALSSQVRSRYSRMVTSADGKGIVQIDGDNCSGCRFTIPFDLRREAARTDMVVSCPHCGKYIYAPDAQPSLSC